MLNSYIEQNLSKDEHILVCEKTSSWYYIPICCVCILLALVAFVKIKDVIDPLGPILWIIIFIGCAIWTYLKYGCVEMVVTNKRVVFKTGFFIHHTNELRLEKIESVDIKKSFFGLIFGYGHIVFTGTGGKVVEFKAISQPQKIKNDIDEIFEKYTQ